MGTEAMERLRRAEEVIKRLLSDEYSFFCQYCIHNNDEDARCNKGDYDGSWCRENAKWNGKVEVR